MIIVVQNIKKKQNAQKTTRLPNRVLPPQPNPILFETFFPNNLLIPLMVQTPKLEPELITIQATMSSVRLRLTILMRSIIMPEFIKKRLKYALKLWDIQMIHVKFNEHTIVPTSAYIPLDNTIKSTSFKSSKIYF